MASHHEFRSPSPDPLAISQDNVPASSPTRTPRRTTSRKPLQDRTGNICSQDFYLTTPPAPRFSPSPTRSTAPADNTASPWRIRVTVEAEPDDARIGLPKKVIAQHTTTTTVPLKTGVDSSPSPVKRGRGRPRKSMDEPLKRSGTPKPKASRKRKTMSAFTEDTAEVMALDAATPARRGRGRPRKSLGPVSHSTGTAMLPTEELELQRQAKSNEPGPEPTKPHSRSRGRRNAMSPIKVTTSDSDDLPVAIRHSLAEPAQGQADDWSLDGTSPQESPFPDSALGKADEARWRSRLRHDSLSPVRSRVLNSGVRVFYGKAINKQDEPIADQTEKHQEYDSILESEGFSMISHSTLPSAEQRPGRVSMLNDQDNQEPSSVSLAPCIETTAGKVDSTSKIVTPAVAPSPELPPQMPSSEAHFSPRPLEKPTDGTPKLTRIVRAGIALQGVLNPNNGSAERSSSAVGTGSCSEPASAQSPKQRMDDLFSGFGPGTRRELRAGLRLGEELARRQKNAQGKTKVRCDDDISSQDATSTYPQLPDSAKSKDYSLIVPAPEQQVEYPALTRRQLPSPEESLIDDEDRMSWKATSPEQRKPALPKAQHHTGGEAADLQFGDKTIDSREAEWQREREAVSKQIEEANTSQVVIINSDGEDEQEPSDDDEDDYDIWQAEARSSEHMNEISPDAFMAQLTNEAPKPKRSKLPRSWRKESKVVYSDEIEATPQDLSLQSGTDAARVIDKGEKAQQQMHQESSPPPARRLAESSEGASSPEHETPLYDGQSSSLESSAMVVEHHKEITITKTERILFPKPQTNTTAPGIPPLHHHQTLHRPASPPPAPSSWLLLGRFFGLSNPAPATPQPLTPVRAHIDSEIIAPIYTHLPWTLLHDYILLCYFLCEPPPVFTPHSPHARFLNHRLSLDGWVHHISKHDIAVIDKFLAVLKSKGVRRPGWWHMGDGKAIEAWDVVKKLFMWWKDGIMHGDLRVRGDDKTGNVPGTNRAWTKKDIIPWPTQEIDTKLLLTGQTSSG